MSTQKNIGIIAIIVALAIVVTLIFVGVPRYTTKQFSDSENFVSDKEDAEKSYSEKLKGRFILKGSECAGFTFIDDKTALWTNEMFCNDPDSLSITWIDATTFTTRSTQRHNPDCPPKVDLYEVVSFNSSSLVLKSTWLGWGEHEPETLEFTKVK
jgi:hypothetical protein